MSDMQRGSIPGTLLKRLPVPGSIVCFHSLTSGGLPASGSANVPVDLFRLILSVLREIGTIVPLSEVITRRGAGRSTDGLFSVTFDDAYAALPTLAGSLLAEEEVPACVFVATDFAAVGAPFWWDRVDDLHPHVDAERWRTFEDVLGLPAAYRAGQPREYGPLRPLRQWLLREFCGRWPTDLDSILTALEREVGISTVHRSMSFEEIRLLAASAPIEIGVHTLSHPVLPLLTDAEQRREIGRSREILEGRYGPVVRALAAPFGLYSERTVQIAKSCGLDICLSVTNQTMRSPPAPDVLPRFIISTGQKPWKLQMKLTGLMEQFRRPAYLNSAGFPHLPSTTT